MIMSLIEATCVENYLLTCDISMPCAFHNLYIHMYMYILALHRYILCIFTYI